MRTTAKIIGNKDFMELFESMVKSYEYHECFYCPVQKKCQALKNDGLLDCGEIIYKYIEKEVV